MSVGDFIKTFLVPGTTWFLLLGLTAGLCLIYLRGKATTWGQRLLTSLVGLYWILSLPVTSGLLTSSLSGQYGRISAPSEARSVEAIVVLAGGSATYQAGNKEIRQLGKATVQRVLETARVYELLGDPLVIASGGIFGDQEVAESEIIREMLVELGVPRDRILLEHKSHNTREHAVNLAPLLQSHGIEHFALVTTALHMWRAKAAFEAVGLHPLPSVARENGTGKNALWALVPSASALKTSAAALQASMGLFYYWIRGWV